MSEKKENIVKRLIVILFSCLAFLTGSGDVIRWQITGDEDVNGNPSVYTYIGTTYGQDSEIGIRLAAYDSSGNFVSYLHPVYGNPSGAFDPATVDYEFDDEYIGTLTDLPANIRQALYSGELAMERRFQMQIGIYDENFDFNPILYSEGLLVEDKYRYTPGDISPEYPFEWAPPEFYTINPVIPSPSVPEPSSSLLCLLGASLLALRRKKA